MDEEGVGIGTGPSQRTTINYTKWSREYSMYYVPCPHSRSARKMESVALSWGHLVGRWPCSGDWQGFSQPVRLNVKVKKFMKLRKTARVSMTPLN